MMQKQFWEKRWQQKQIGFHQSQINPYLIKFWNELKIPAASKVFVPLCGKSLDLLWLKEQGHEVIGIEFSQLAVEDFFHENQLDYYQKTKHSLQHFISDQVTLICGDFFALKKNDLINTLFVYDRAAIVALPSKLRSAYVEHLNKILPQKVQILLITMEYSQDEMDGPPFCVDESEIRFLFEPYFNVDKRETNDIYQENPRFQAKGLSRLIEKVFLISR